MRDPERATGEGDEEVAETVDDDHRGDDDGEGDPPPQRERIGDEVLSHGVLVPEPEQDGEVRGEVNEVPRLV